MIVCANCKFQDPHSFKGNKSEEKFLSVIDATTPESEKRFLCGVDCYATEIIKAEFTPEDDENFDEADYKEYFNKRYPEVKSRLMAFPAIQDFLKRNGRAVPEPAKEFDVHEEIKDWADC